MNTYFHGTKAGHRDDIHDITGILSGHAARHNPDTGVSIVIFPDNCVGSVDVRGGAPGSREIDALQPGHVVDDIHGLFFTGGSAHGLAAGSVVSEYLYNQGQGVRIKTNVPVVPIVAGAVIYDLQPAHNNLALKSCYETLAQEAISQLGTSKPMPRHGAGAGARDGSAVGGGLSCASRQCEDIVVASMMVANPVGRIAQEGLISLSETKLGGMSLAGGQTTIGVVITNAKLDKLQLKRMAIMAHDGMARAINPSHTPHDGDLIFAVSTGDIVPPLPTAVTTMLCGQMAAEAVEFALKKLAP